MYNLVMKDLKLGVSPWFFALPPIMGLLMFVPAWVYLIVPLYFCFITIPNVFGGFKSQNDLTFSSLMPVTKKDIVKARFAVIILLELLHLLFGMLFSIFTFRLYPNMSYIFFPPHLGFWGICFVMFGIFNIFLLPMYYKTAYKYGAAATASTTAVILFAGLAQWAGISHPGVHGLFYGSGLDNIGLQLSLLLAGAAIFAVLTFIAYRISARRFLNVEMI